MAARVLSSDQSVARRPFTSPGLYPRDLAILGYMLEDLRALLVKMDAGKPSIVAYQPIEWLVHDLKRRVVIGDSMSLHNRRQAHLVGFFGERHLDRDSAPLEEANLEIVLELRNYPGILSYSSMELVDGNWANLVLHNVAADRETWRASEAHARVARELSPQFYRTVRIHNGILPDGVMGSRSIVVERTKYWDYGSKTVWHAVRELATPSPGLAH
ncbi:MAG: hypothetical protein ACRDWH_09010 [Acidimicrobiia bacterium]